MPEPNRKSWRDLCSAALQAQDPDELLKIVQELNQVLQREEQLRRDYRKPNRVTQSPGDIRCHGGGPNAGD